MPRVFKILGYVAVVVLAVLGALAIVSGSPWGALESGSASETLPVADEAPLDYVYLDAERTDAYLAQALNGLPTSEQRTEDLTRSVNASLGSGTGVQLGGSQQTQQSTVATITPQAVDRFYTFLRLLRKEGEADVKQKTCRHDRLEIKDRPFWLGDINDQGSEKEIVDDVKCIGVGNFVRIHNAQLFLPPFAQALPRVQSANAFFGALPAPRTPFTSPVQAVGLGGALRHYTNLVGHNPRLPFVAGPFGSFNRIGSGVTFFLPTHYQEITSEPSLLSGSVTIVGKMIYFGSGHQRYVDYPTIYTFGRALQGAKSVLLGDLGVCSKTPPPATRPQAPRSYKAVPARPRKHLAYGTSMKPSNHLKRHKAGCISAQESLNDVKKSVSFKSPVVVVLPLAIYQ